MYKYQDKTHIDKPSDEITSFLEQYLHTLKTPSIYLGREINATHKDWDEDKTKIILYMPLKYQAGINNMGVAILYNNLNEKTDVICERGYMPESELRKKLIKKGYPTGFSLESKHQLKDFDCIGFSCYFELQFLNLIYTLYYSGIPLYAAERKECDNDKYPIVIIGGVAAYSPAAVEEIVDIVFIGDGEEQMDIFATKLATYKARSKTDKTAFLLDCAKTIPGCYVPRFYDFKYIGRSIESISPKQGLPYPVVKACRDISHSTPFYKQILPVEDSLHIGYGSVEIARGCYNSCRFCMASAIYKPYREYPIEKIEKAIDNAIGYLGCNNITPHSLNYSSYSQRYNLLQFMAEKLKYVSSSSQRVDTFSRTLAEVLHKRGSKRATFAIEAGSQRMRDVINKEITDKHIDYSLRTLIDLKYSSVKIYMISGLPFETRDNALEIIETLEPIVNYAKKRTRFKILLSYTQFTAKPFTALQWADVSEVLDAKSSEGWGYYKDIKAGLKIIGISAKRSLRKAEHIMLQLLNRVDRRFTDALVKAVIEDGLIYPVMSTNKRIADLPKDTDPADRLQAFIDYLDKLCLDFTGSDIRAYFEEIPPNMILPWDVLSTGVKKDWLVSEYRKARETTVTPSCMRNCTNCGICTDPDITRQYKNPHPKYTDEAFSNDIHEKALASLLAPSRNESRGKILVDLMIPEESRFTESVVLQRQLILAFNSTGMYIDSVFLQSDLTYYKAYRHGSEFGILTLRSDATRCKLDKTLLATINDKLEGLIEVISIRYTKNPKNDTLANAYTHALYKLKVYPVGKEDLVESLEILDKAIDFQQPSKKYMRRKTKINSEQDNASDDSEQNVKKFDEPMKATIPFVKAIPNNRSFIVYALVPLDVNVYYLLKHLTGRRSILGLMRQPLERIVFIHTIEGIDTCSCGRLIEAVAPLVSVENKLLKTHEGLCASCIIDKWHS